MTPPVGAIDNGTDDFSSPNSQAFQHGYNANGQLTSLADAFHSGYKVNQATYGPAGELLQLRILDPSYTPYWLESREYNSLGQMTRQKLDTVNASWNPQANLVQLDYNFPTTANDGRLSSRASNISNETVSYTYDNLGRLATAQAATWGLSFVNDRWGNRTSQTATLGAPPHWVQTVDPGTNQIDGYGYDAASNLTGAAGVSLAYDIHNRIWRTNNGTVIRDYFYDAANRRIARRELESEKWYLTFYGIDGLRLGTWHQANLLRRPPAHRQRPTRLHRLARVGRPQGFHQLRLLPLRRAEKPDADHLHQRNAVRHLPARPRLRPDTRASGETRSTTLTRGAWIEQRLVTLARSAILCPTPHLALPLNSSSVPSGNRLWY